MSDNTNNDRELLIDESADREWRGGVYLCTAINTFEADIFESKLNSEGIPCLRKYKGAGNFIEISMGSSMAYPIDIYVPAKALEDAENIVVAIPLVSDNPEGLEDEDFSDDPDSD